MSKIKDCIVIKIDVSLDKNDIFSLDKLEKLIQTISKLANEENDNESDKNERT